VDRPTRLLETSVQTYLFDRKQENAWTETEIRNLKDKARRDAQLYAALVSYLKSLQHSDPGATCLLVSSARRLAAAESTFKRTAEPELIVSISTVLQLLSLAPNVSLGLSAMKAFLFDERPNVYSSDFERTLLRMVRSSDQISMPWAKRGNLMRSVRGKMLSDARKSGLKTTNAELEKVAFASANRPSTIEALRDALDAIAVDTKTARENLDLRKEVADLKAALAASKQPITRAQKGKPYRPPKKK
jgi:hypothetical protein